MLNIIFLPEENVTLEVFLRNYHQKMKKELDFRKDQKNRLKDRDFRSQFEEEKIYARIAVDIARLREKEGLTQEELARAVHTTQQNISRLEGLHNQSLSLSTLIKIAQALHKRLRVKFV